MTLAILVCSSLVYGHTEEGEEAEWIRFVGDWRGEVEIIKEGLEFPIRAQARVVISENGASSYYCSNNSWISSSDGKEQDRFPVVRNNAVFIWMAKGGIWSETQIFSLSYVNEESLDLTWTRHVNNMREGDNQTWYYFGQGTLTKWIEASGDC